MSTMAGKRDRIEIMAEILELCLAPTSKTRVMYGTNLSWKMLQHYLAHMQERRLLEVRKRLKKYITTEKGRDFIEKWRELKELF